MPSRPIRFFHRGAVVEVDGVAPDPHRARLAARGRALHRHQGRLQRGRLRRLHRRDRRAGRAGRRRRGARPALQTVNACIQFLPTLRRQGAVHGRGPDGGRTAALHPVQQAMVECHGSQCGFCTPGFVMSLWSTYEHHRRARHAADAPAARRRAVRQPVPLHRLPADPRRRRAHVRPAGRAARHRAGAAPRCERLRATTPLRLRRAAAPTLPSRRARSTNSPRCAPRIPRRACSPARPTSACGSTSSSATLGDIIYVGDVDELKRIERARRRALRSAPAPRSRTPGARWSRRCPTLTDVWLRFASPPIRNAGTMGGNVANGSPIGDSPPVLIALDAADRAAPAASACAACRWPTSTSTT